jgi:hypothetical protein
MSISSTNRVVRSSPAHQSFRKAASKHCLGLKRQRDRAKCRRVVAGMQLQAGIEGMWIMNVKRHQQVEGKRSAYRGYMILALMIIGVVALPFFVGNTTSSLALSAADKSAGRGVETKIIDLHPFTHLASMPASSDPANIKLEKVKTTRVFTKEKSTTDPGYCKDLQFRDPGGSMYCPYTEDESPAPAYEVIYSFHGQPLASDEYGNRYFTLYIPSIFSARRIVRGLTKSPLHRQNEAWGVGDLFQCGDISPPGSGSRD